MRKFTRRSVLPALLRPGMYVGEQTIARTREEWQADAVAAYLNYSVEMEERSGTKLLHEA